MSKMYRLVSILIVSYLVVACGGAPEALIGPTAQPTEAPAVTAAPTPTEVQPLPPTSTEAIATQTPAEEPAQEGAAESVTPDVGEPEAGATVASEQSDEELLAALQETVDLWSEAYNNADVELLRTAIDPKAFSLRRTQESLMEYFTGGQAGGRSWNGEVVDLNRRELGYVQARVDIGGSRFPFTFKEVDGRWLLSEPRRAELGDRKTIETEHFRFEYYPWDETVGPEIAQMMEEAHSVVVERMGKGPEQKSLVKLIPTTELGNTAGGVLAFYRRGSGSRIGQQEMVINSPDSFGVVSYDAAAGWREDMAVTLAHEYVHLVNDCCFTPIYRQNDWMTEGIAVYISEGGYTSGYAGAVARAVQNDALIPIQAEPASPGAVPQDLESLSELEVDRGLAYGLAGTLVEYIVDNYGGLEGYWKLVGDYDKTQDFEQSLQNVLGISFEEFERGWREELRKRFG